MRNAIESFILSLIKILYMINKVPANTKQESNLITINSFPKIFKNTEQIIGNNGAITKLISLYGKSPSWMHLAKL